LIECYVKGAIFLKDPELILKENPGSVVFAPYAEILARNGEVEKALEILRKE